MKIFYLKYLYILLLVLLKLPGTFAQAPPSYTSADIYVSLQKLKVLGAVLYMAAHPDDENTRLLAYLSKDRLYRTGYLSLTRGDGGQNLIGDEQGIDLGLIRTQELLSARRIDGAEQFFSRAYDFGFSKSTDEAFSKWGKEKILSDAVWVIRKFQPDVIITRFPEDSRAGHGHHSGSAVIAHEAFRAAADPTRFPEQFQYGVKPWKVKRILWNSFNFGGNNTTSESQLKIEVGGYNAILGRSYGEIAAESRSQHKSQGFGFPASRGSQLEYFSFVEGEAYQNDLMDGVTVSWSKVEGGAAIDAMIDEVIKNYSLLHPELSVPALVKVYQAMATLKDGYWRTQKMQEVQQLVERCSGLWLEATTNTEFAVQGDSIRVNFAANNRLGARIKMNRIALLADVDTAINRELEKNRNVFLPTSIYVLSAFSQPYWLREKMGEGSFTVNDQTLIGMPQNDPAYQAKFEVTIEGQPFTFVKPLQYKYSDPVKGELYQPLVVVPPATVTTEPSIVIFKSNEKQADQVMIKITANRVLDRYKASVARRLTNDNSVKTDSNFSLQKNMSREYVFDVNNNLLKGMSQDYVQAFITLEKDGKTWNPWLNVTSIEYDHIPHIHYFYQDAIKVLNIDIKTVGKKIGYIEGAGDKVTIALQQMGYDVTILKEKDITAGMLRQFDAVMTGVRAYNVHDFLPGKYEVLMDYVQQGGNLIVQYNNNNMPAATRPRIAPYPLTISNKRITDENATVNFLLPDHPVLNYPNKITGKDFEGWVQERGIYFADQVDAIYETPLSMADPGEDPLKGSLLIANYGKGKFVYTGLVFFRELPAGVPGAYRLLANIIALNKKRGF